MIRRAAWKRELYVLAVCLTTLIAQDSKAQTTAPPAPDQLTVKRIYSQPSLSGRPYRGVQWSPDSKTVSFFESTGQGKDAKTELSVIDAVTGERRLLVPAERLETALPPDKSQPTQATGLGRRPASQYFWSPDGASILFIGGKSLSLLDLKTQQARVLLAGQLAITDVKFSPNGKQVSYVSGHNLHSISLSDGKDQTLTTGGTEEVRKGELDWVYPEELDLKTAYWWSPDSTKIAFLQMDERKVSKYPLVDFASYEGEREEERYPVAGGANPVVQVYTVEISGGKTKLMDSGTETNQYIPRVDWLQDSRRVAIQRLNRAQTQLDLLVADASTGKSSVLLTEKDAYWINVSDALRFFKDGKR